ncbi:GTPase Era [bacterium]|nr:GTPase Era [bacterium]
MNETPVYKVGYAALAGRPNVGKSSLMNCFLNQKLAIVSPRPQTTRHRILGIMNGPDHQVILMDTPGLMEPQYLLQEAMAKTAVSAFGEADIVLLLLEATGINADDERVIEAVTQTGLPVLLVINKIDLVDRRTLLPLMQQLHEQGLYREIIPISALKRDGIEALQRTVITHMPAGEPFYPPDMITDEPERFFVSELIREKIFLQYGQEIPYATAVIIEEFKERPGRKDYINADVYVERSSQKAILIGKNGRALKRLGQSARQDIEEMLDRPVFLDLNVKVGKKWRRDPRMMKRLGY